MKKEIEYLLFDSGLSNYQISKGTGISQVTLGRYSKGEADIENMTLGNAIKLYSFYQQSREDGKVGNKDRDLLFGRLLGVSNVFGDLVFEKNKISVSDKYMQRFAKAPATTWAAIHADLMGYTHKFGKKENKLMTLFDEIVGQMDEDDFTDKPLGDKYLIGYYKQQHALKNLQEDE